MPNLQNEAYSKAIVDISRGYVSAENIAAINDYVNTLRRFGSAVMPWLLGVPGGARPNTDAGVIRAVAAMMDDMDDILDSLELAKPDNREIQNDLRKIADAIERGEM